MSSRFLETPNLADSMVIRVHRASPSCRRQDVHVYDDNSDYSRLFETEIHGGGLCSSLSSPTEVSLSTFYIRTPGVYTKRTRVDQRIYYSGRNLRGRFRIFFFPP